jgi:carbon-monoxide dehydrogenase medium subunit
MLNLRLARPALLIDVTAIPELAAVEATEEAVTIGAAVTHAAIEDGRLPDIGQGVLPWVARGIAYRAIRNRGTMGGSLAHADPAADWPVALRALDASVLTYSGRGARRIALGDFILGAFATLLEPDEILTAIHIPRLSKAARWSWYKVCRKPGEFAAAIAGVLVDPARALRRAVLGGGDGAAILLEGEAALRVNADAAFAAAASGRDPYERQVQAVALRRALAALSE